MPGLSLLDRFWEGREGQREGEAQRVPTLHSGEGWAWGVEQGVPGRSPVPQLPVQKGSNGKHSHTVD